MDNNQVDIRSEVEEHVGTMSPVIGLNTENDDVINEEIIESLSSILESDDLIEEGVDDFMQTAQSISRFDGGILNINCAKLHK